MYSVHPTYGLGVAHEGYAARLGHNHKPIPYLSRCDGMLEYLCLLFPFSNKFCMCITADIQGHHIRNGYITCITGDGMPADVFELNEGTNVEAQHDTHFCI